MAFHDGRTGGRMLPVRARRGNRRHIRDWLATGVIVAGGVALGIPLDRTDAAGPHLELVPATVVAGASVDVRGTGFARFERVTIAVAGGATLGTATTGGNGAFRARLTPSSLPGGWHTVTATQTPSGSRAWTRPGTTLAASAVLTILGSPSMMPHAVLSPSTSPVSSWPTPSPRRSPPPTPAPTPSPTPSPGAGFVRASGTNLTLDGRPYRFSGFNIYNANSRWNCGGPMVDGGLERALDDIGGGAEVFRAWFFQPLATTSGGRDWAAFDATLATARAHGVKVIVTLTDHWGACESTGIKNEAWYASGYRTTIHGGERVTYREFVAEIVARYRDDPTILMWQLVNEAESKTTTGTCSSAAVLRAFATDVAGLVQRLDPNHLVSLGTMGGGQCATQGADYQALHALPEIDVCEVHDYWDNAPMPGDQWNGFAVRVAQCDAIGKPLFVGEVGRRPQNAGGSLASRAEIFGAKFAAQYGAGVDGILLWGWRNGDDGGSATHDFDIGPGDPALVHVRAY